MSETPQELFPAFLKLKGRPVVLVGGGRVAAGKLHGLLDAGACVTVVAPEICDAIARTGVAVVQRRFEPEDLRGAWWVVAAAPADVNREVLAAAEEHRVFVNAVDDPNHATAYAGGVVRRDGVTVAISTDGRAPALAGLLREAFAAYLPGDLGEWMRVAEAARLEWRRVGLPMEERRPDLLAKLNELYRQNTGAGSRGHVSIVGAGPGDPDLWTVRAVRLLREADLVLYDSLVDVQALRQMTKAQCFCVGKRAGRKSVQQETIHRLMIQSARKGKHVVRLKGGDPFVFGRGAEEALALSAAGITFEVVPGVSSATAAPALAGIPVTHRGLASAFLVVSGHTTDGIAEALAAVQPNSVSLVVLMGVAGRDALAVGLIARGWNSETPAAIVCGASTEDAWTWTGSLTRLGEAVPPPGVAGVLVVGDVVRVREALAAAQEGPATLINEVKYGRH